MVALCRRLGTFRVKAALVVTLALLLLPSAAGQSTVATVYAPPSYFCPGMPSSSTVVINPIANANQNLLSSASAAPALAVAAARNVTAAMWATGLDSLNNIVYTVDSSGVYVFDIRPDGSSTIVAGIAGVTSGYTPAQNGVAATSVPFLSPFRLIVDRYGAPSPRIFISDAAKCVIHVLQSSNLTTYLGNGTCAYSANNTARVATTLYGPRDMAYADTIRLFFWGELDYPRIMVLDESRSIVRVFAGSATTGLTGLRGSLVRNRGMAFAPRQQVLFVADTDGHRVLRFGAFDSSLDAVVAGTLGVGGFTGDGGAASAALLNTPVGVAVVNETNALLISEGGSTGSQVFSVARSLQNSRVRMVTPSGQIYTFIGPPMLDNGTVLTTADADAFYGGVRWGPSAGASFDASAWPLSSQAGSALGPFGQADTWLQLPRMMSADSDRNDVGKRLVLVDNTRVLSVACISPTPSVTASTSPSTTASVSVSASRTVTASATTSISSSRSISSSGSPSLTRSGSLSVSITGTVSASVSPSVSGSGTISPSQSRSSSATASVSSSLTVSGTASPSRTGSGTNTASATSSVAASPSVSRTESVTASVSPTTGQSASISQSISPSISASLSRSPDASTSVTASSSVTASVSGSPSASASTSPSLSVSASVFPSSSPSPSSTASTSPTSSASASIPGPTPSTTASASATPAPSTPATIIMRFEGSLHALDSAPIPEGGVPATIIARGWAPPLLRVSGGGGCLPAPGSAVRIRCAANSDRGRLAAVYAPGLPPSIAAAGTTPDRVASALALAPASAQLTTVAGGGVLGRAGCGALAADASASFLVFDNRSWPMASSSAASGTAAGLSSGYAFPQAEALVLTCRMTADSVLLAEASAPVLLLAPALPVPSEIFVFRPAMWALQSLRNGALVTLPSSAAASSGAMSSSGGSGRTPSGSGNGTTGNFVDSPSGVNAAVDPSLVAAPDALAAAALSYSYSMAQTEQSAAAGAFPVRSQSQGQSLALTGSATLVVLLGAARASNSSTSSSGSTDTLQYPSLALLRAEASAMSTSTSSAADAALAIAGLASVRRSLRLAARIGGVRANVTWISADGSAAVLAAPSFAAVCASTSTSSSTGIGSPAIVPASASSARSGSCGYQALQLWYENDAAWGDGGSGSTGSGGAVRRLTPRGLQAGSHSPSVSPLIAWASQWLAAAQAGGATAANATAATTAAAVSGHLLPAPVVVQSPPWTPGTVPAGSLPLAVSLSAVSVAAAASLPAPSESWMGALVPGRPVTASDGSLVSIEPQASSLAALALGFGSGAGSGSGSSSGDEVLSGSGAPFFYTAACSAAGFTDPTTGACTNSSDPAFPRCAFGAGDDCKPCPRWPTTGSPAAVCPGGYRAWPVSGAYTPSEGSGLILRCAPPATERCLGWSAAASDTVCGAGYSGVGCGGCAPSYYPSITGRCTACPGLPSMSPLLRAALLFTGIVAAACGAILAIAFLAAKFIGGSVRGAFARCVELLAFLVSLLQMLGQVGRTLPPGLPPAVETVFAFLVTVQLEDPSLPTACWPEGYAFRNQVAQMAVALFFGSALVATMLLLGTRCCSCGPSRAATASPSPTPAGSKVSSTRYRLCCRPGGASQASPLVDRSKMIAGASESSCAARLVGRLPALLLKALFMVLALVYATVANTSLGLLACSRTPISPSALAVLDGGSAALAAGAAAEAAANPDGTAAVLLLASDPSFVCWQGSHAPAAALAAATVLLFVAGFPLGLILWGRHRVMSVADTGAAKELSVTLTRSMIISQGKATAQSCCSILVCPRPAPGGPLHEMATADAGARAAYVRSRPVLSRARYLCCGWEWAMTRWQARRLRGDRASTGDGKGNGKTNAQPASSLVSPLDAGLQLSPIPTRGAASGAAMNAKAALLYAAGSQRRVSVLSTAAGASATPGGRRASTAPSTSASTGPRAARASRASTSTGASVSESKVLPSPELVLAAIADDEANSAKDSPEAQAQSQASFTSTATRLQRPSVVATRRSSIAASATSAAASAAPDAGASTASASLSGPPPGLLLLHSLNTSGAVQADVPLSAFLGTATRPASFYARQIDASVLAGLAAVQLFWPAPSSLAMIAARCSVYAGLLLLDAWQTWRANPFLLSDGWKLRANVGFLLLAALAAILTHVSLWAAEAAVDGSGGDPAADRAREYLAWAFLVGAAFMLCLIVGGFLFAVIRDARGEAGEKKRQLAERAALLATAAATVPGLHRVIAPARRPSVAPSLGPGAFAAFNPLTAQGDADSLETLGAASNLRGLRSKRLSRAGPDTDATAEAAMRASPGAAVTAAVRRTSLAPMGIGGTGLAGASFFAPSAAPSAMRSRSGKGIMTNGRSTAAAFGPTPMAGASAGAGLGLGTASAPRPRRTSRASVSAISKSASLAAAAHSHVQAPVQADGNVFSHLLVDAVEASRSAAEAE